MVWVLHWDPLLIISSKEYCNSNQQYCVYSKQHICQNNEIQLISVTAVALINAYNNRHCSEALVLGRPPDTGLNKHISKLKLSESRDCGFYQMADEAPLHLTVILHLLHIQYSFFGQKYAPARGKDDRSQDSTVFQYCRTWLQNILRTQLFFNWQWVSSDAAYILKNVCFMHYM